MKLALPNHITDIRSQIQVEACITSCFISETFVNCYPTNDLGEFIIDKLFSLLKSKVKAVSTIGWSTMEIYLKNAASLGILQILLEKRQSKSDIDRQRLMESFVLIFNCWPEKLIKHVKIKTNLIDMVFKFISDRNSETRTCARDCFLLMKRFYPKECQKFELTLTDGQRKILNEQNLNRPKSATSNSSNKLTTTNLIRPKTTASSSSSSNVKKFKNIREMKNQSQNSNSNSIDNSNNNNNFQFRATNASNPQSTTSQSSMYTRDTSPSRYSQDSAGTHSSSSKMKVRSSSAIEKEAANNAKNKYGLSKSTIKSKTLKPKSRIGSRDPSLNRFSGGESTASNTSGTPSSTRTGRTLYNTTKSSRLRQRESSVGPNLGAGDSNSITSNNSTLSSLKNFRPKTANQGTGVLVPMRAKTGLKNRKFTSQPASRNESPEDLNRIKNNLLMKSPNFLKTTPNSNTTTNQSPHQLHNKNLMMTPEMKVVSEPANRNAGSARKSRIPSRTNSRPVSRDPSPGSQVYSQQKHAMLQKGREGEKLIAERLQGYLDPDEKINRNYKKYSDSDIKDVLLICGSTQHKDIGFG